MIATLELRGGPDITTAAGRVALLASLFRGRVVVLHGGMGVRARRRADELLASEGTRVVLAPGRYIGEGFDDPRLDTLMLAMRVAWKGAMTQYAGRLHRHHDAKYEIRIIDYVDHAVPVLRRMYANARAHTRASATARIDRAGASIYADAVCISWAWAAKALSELGSIGEPMSCRCFEQPQTGLFGELRPVPLSGEELGRKNSPGTLRGKTLPLPGGSQRALRDGFPTQR